MKKVLLIARFIITFVLLFVIMACYVFIFHINKDNKYNNDFKYQKTVYYENNKINKKISELVKKDILVSNNVLDKKYVNLLAKEDGNYKSYIYQYYTGNKVGIDKIFKNDEGYQLFTNKVEEMCNLKYPKFVCTELMDNGEKSYEILNNKINVYFNKTEMFQNVVDNYMVEVNYAELIIDDKNILNYSFSLDSNYENPNVFKIDPNKKIVAFSFDDGPGPYTNQIVDALVDHHFKATFFVVGNRLYKYKDNLKYEFDRGMEIGNHSYDHSNLAKLKNGKLETNINQTATLIKEITGQDTFLIRPPYGAINDYVKESLPNAFILWDVDTNDWLYRDKDYIHDYLLNHLKDGDIALMHDIHATTKEAVLAVLDELYLNNYQVVSVGELANLKGITLEAHHAYRSFK